MAYIQYPDAYDKAVKNYIIQNASKTFRKDPNNCKALEYVLAHAHPGGTDFFSSLADAWETYGKLTPKQVAAVLKIMDDRAAKKTATKAKIDAQNAKSQFVGDVGKRVQMILDVVKVISITYPPKFYNDPGWTDLVILKDGDNVLIYKGRVNLGKAGDKVALKATVKDHAVYDGYNQTVLTRPAVVDIIHPDVVAD